MAADSTTDSRLDTRFFIVKSFNEENVYKCMEDGVWATQMQNGEVLTTAFAQCKSVILFFSINKSKAFQGFARMSTAPSPDTPRPRWLSGMHWDTTPPFRVEWLSMTEVGFQWIGHIKNTLNENRPVLVGRDGQEIEEQAGRELFQEMALIAESPRGAADHRPSYRPEARDRDEPRFIKRENDRW
ncbi:YTH-domain-containing protein [Thozetella sp. PMI_491]|nr:YTH-domain-containing protein [Thozetella sp. PMI_491]